MVRPTLNPHIMQSKVNFHPIDECQVSKAALKAVKGRFELSIYTLHIPFLHGHIIAKG